MQWYNPNECGVGGGAGGGGGGGIGVDGGSIRGSSSSSSSRTGSTPLAVKPTTGHNVKPVQSTSSPQTLLYKDRCQ